MPSHFSASSNHRPTPKGAGFSLVELMVSIGIVVLVLSIVVTRQQSFNGAVLLRSQAYELALAIREIQQSALSAVSDGSGEFREAQGVMFREGEDNRFRLFRDQDGNGFYSNGEDIGAPAVLDPRFEIRSIELGLSNSDDLAVVFRRPNFDALFFTGPNSQNITATQAIITIGLRGGSGTVCGEDIRQIGIKNTGQISVIEC